MEIYIAKENSDLTEGRGPMRVVGYYTNENAAVAAVKGRGVMGVGDGEVVSVEVLDTYLVDADHPHRDHTQFYEIRVYGYRKNWNGKWDYGYVDLRDAPKNDPEYATYIRLQAKFGGMR